MKALTGLLLLAACGGSSPSPAPTLPGPTPDPAPGSDPTATPAPPPPKAAVGKPKNDLIPRALLFGNPERVAVRLSPDGKQLSWMAPKNGVMNVWVAPIDKLDQAKAVTDEKTRPIPGYNWAFTSKHILYQQDVGGDENYHLFKTDVADGKTTELTPNKGARAELVALDPKQPNKVWVSINDRDPKVFDLHEYDLASGKRTLVVQNDDGAGVPHDVVPEPAEALHVLERVAAEPGPAEVVLVGRLGEVGVQPHPQPAGQLGRLAHQLARHREG